MSHNPALKVILGEFLRECKDFRWENVTTLAGQIVTQGFAREGGLACGSANANIPMARVGVVRLAVGMLALTSFFGLEPSEVQARSVPVLLEPLVRVDEPVPREELA